MGRKVNEDATKSCLVHSFSCGLYYLLDQTFSIPHSPVGSCIQSFWNHRSKQRKLLSCKSSWFLPNFLKWNLAALPALSWLMRANLAIFSLVFLKCGCKKLQAQLASPSEEHEGVAAVGWQGRPPHCLQTFSKGTEAGRSQLPSSALCSSAALAAVFGGILSTWKLPSLQWFDRCLWTDHGVWNHSYSSPGDLGPERAQAYSCLTVRAVAVLQCISSAARPGVNPSSAEDLLCGPG